MSWLSKLENYLLVTLITVLVWLYAEGRAIRTEQAGVQVQFVAPAGREDRLAIRPRQPLDARVVVKGSSSQLATFENLVGDGPIRLAIDEETRSPLSMPQALAESVLGELGVNIEEVQPHEVNVSAERIDQLTLPVAVQAQEVQLAPNPTVMPDQVQVRLPASLAGRAVNPRVLASLEDVDLGQIPVNVPTTVDVRLQLPPALRSEWSRIEPATASVTFTIRKINDTLQLDSLPVRISVPPRMLQDWRFSLDDRNRVLDGVMLSGPGDVIEQIRSRQREVFAEIRPRIDDLKPGVVKLPVFIQTPPGVTVVSPTPTVDLQVSAVEPQP